jgi:hypothetical protein
MAILAKRSITGKVNQNSLGNNSAINLKDTLNNRNAATTDISGKVMTTTKKDNHQVANQPELCTSNEIESNKIINLVLRANLKSKGVDTNSNPLLTQATTGKVSDRDNTRSNSSSKSSKKEGLAILDSKEVITLVTTSTQT